MKEKGFVLNKKLFFQTRALRMGYAIAGAGIYAGIFLKFGMTPSLIMWIIFASEMLWLSFTDRTKRILPNRILASVALNRLLFLILLRDFFNQLPVILACVFCVFVPLTVIVLGMEWIRNKKLIGRGDMKLILVLCLYFDQKKLLFLLAASCLLALVHVGGDRMFRQTRWGKSRIAKSSGTENGEFPFGPFFTAAAMITVLCAES